MEGPITRSASPPGIRRWFGTVEIICTVGRYVIGGRVDGLESVGDGGRSKKDNSGKLALETDTPKLTESKPGIKKRPIGRGSPRVVFTQENDMSQDDR